MPCGLLLPAQGGDATVRHNRIVTLLASLCLAMLLTGNARAEDAATLTITADSAEIRGGGAPVSVVFTFHVAPPAGQEIGVFSIRLLPTEGMTLSDEDVWVNETLAYSNFNRSGVFRTFEYTPQSRFFAAVGSSPGQRMKEAADVLQVTATIPGGVYGSFTMDAEFIAAPDGSGVSFTPVVHTATVTVTSPGGTSTPPATTPPDAAPGNAAPGTTAPGTTAPGNAVSGTTSPVEAAPGDNQVTFDAAPADATVQESAPAANGAPGGGETEPGGEDAPVLIAPRRATTWPLWAALALAAAAVAVQVLHPGGWGALLRRKNDNKQSDTEGEGKQ